MLAGGAHVNLVGFRRSDVENRSVEGCETIDLGRSYPTRLGHRAALIAIHSLRAKELVSNQSKCDAIIATNLDMLFLANRARNSLPIRPKLIYECLDIHSTMLSKNPLSLTLRKLERYLLSKSNLVITSSPAFVEHYFKAVQSIRTPILLVENKALCLDKTVTSLPPDLTASEQPPPWRIGWFGKLRARKNLEILIDIARHYPDLVEIEIRGVPDPTCADLEEVIVGHKNVHFFGSYKAEDLPHIYNRVHFVWCYDFLSENDNSKWLLPNRVYEGGQFGAVAFASPETQTGSWLAKHGIGILLREPAQEMGPFLQNLTYSDYTMLRSKVGRVPRNAFIAEYADCQSLLDAIATC
jgi:hypothetical protein